MSEFGRVIITHDFCEAFGGAERVTAEIAKTFPEAIVYAILGRQTVARRMGVDERLRVVIGERPRLLAHYRKLAPLYPAIVRSRRLPAADLLLSSSYAYANAFRTENDAPHLCYCHSPLRHAWSMEDDYAREVAQSWPVRKAYGAYCKAARSADRVAARAVDRFLTQSPFIADQILEAYGREATILPPPVDCTRFKPSSREPGDYYLYAGRLVETYKRPSLVIEAFARMPDRRLLVAGTGPAIDSLRARATPNVQFLGLLDDRDLVRTMQDCRCLLFTSCDDFGLVPIEVQACGRPVLAFADGGVMHSVLAGTTGEFFYEPTVDAVVDAVTRFDPERYDSAVIRQHALQWDSSRFRSQLEAEATRILEDRAGDRTLGTRRRARGVAPPAETETAPLSA